MKFKLGDKVRYIYSIADEIDTIIGINEKDQYPYLLQKPDGNTYAIHESALEWIES